MIPSKNKIDELKEIAKRDFGVEWTDQEASEAAFNLVNYFDTLMRCAGEDIQEHIRTGQPSSDGKMPEYDEWVATQAKIAKKTQESN